MNNLKKSTAATVVSLLCAAPTLAGTVGSIVWPPFHGNAAGGGTSSGGGGSASTTSSTSSSSAGGSTSSTTSTPLGTPTEITNPPWGGGLSAQAQNHGSGSSHSFHTVHSAGILVGEICQCQLGSPEGPDGLAVYFANFKGHLDLQLVVPSVDITCQYAAAEIVGPGFASLGLPAKTWSIQAVQGASGLNAVTFYHTPSNAFFFIPGGTTTTTDAHGVNTITFNGTPPVLPIGSVFDAIYIYTQNPGNPFLANALVDGMHILPDTTDTPVDSCFLDNVLPSAPIASCEGFPNQGESKEKPPHGPYCGFKS